VEALMPSPVAWVGVAALGLIIGSFLNVCIHRLPRRESIVHPRSRCPDCGGLIRWYDNIPLLSYAFLRGRCRGCGTSISWVYPAVEAANAAAYLALAARYGTGLTFALLAAFISAVIALVVIDARHQILPDRITLPLLGVGLVSSLWSPEVSAAQSLIGAAVGAAAPALLLLLWQWCFGIEGMGWGDVKMLAMVGSFLGPARAVLTLLSGACLGAVVGLSLLAARRGTLRTPLPFGVFLGIAAAAALWWGNDVVDWYAVRLKAVWGAGS
jgi:leader peptidase (prepilin peptidase)/N-methyltransferase